MRKFPAIDLMKLKASGSFVGWNQMLETALAKQNINKLVQVRYGIQAGMDDLAKKKLNSEDIINWWLRLNKSIEDTAKKIIRIKNPSPNDDAITALTAPLGALEAKRKRDKELAEFLRRSSY